MRYSYLLCAFMLEVEQGAKILNFDQNFMMSQIEYRILKLLFVDVLCASFVVFFSFGKEKCF